MPTKFRRPAPIRESDVLSADAIAALDAVPMPAKPVWTAAEDEALRRYWPTRQADTLATAWRKAFGRNRSPRALEMRAFRLGIRKQGAAQCAELPG